MGTRDFLIWSPEVIRIAIVMGFGSIIWIFAMRELLRKNESSEENKTVVNIGNHTHKSAAGTTLQLTYITQEQILDLTAEQLKEIPESEVDKLPTAMKALFKRHRNEVMLADRAKNSK
jgi:hypothetical protein